MKLTPFKAILAGGVIGILLVAGTAAVNPNLSTWVGAFYGDGSNLSNVVASSSVNPIIVDPITWIDLINGPQTNTWAYDGQYWYFNGYVRLLGHLSLGTGSDVVWNQNSSYIGYGTGTGFVIFDAQTPTKNVNIKSGIYYGDGAGISNSLWTANTILYANSGKFPTSLANGTGYLHDNGSGTFAYQLISLSDLNAGGTYPSGNGQQITNVLQTDLVDPTNGVSSASAVDFSVPDATTNVSAAFGFTSLLNFNSTNYNYAIRHVPNTSGSSQTMTVASSWKTDGLRTTATTYTITNNTTWTFFFECQIGQFTNVHAIVAF